MEKNIQVFDVKTGCRKVIFFDMFKNKEINFLHYIFLPFYGWWPVLITQEQDMKYDYGYLYSET